MFIRIDIIFQGRRHQEGSLVGCSVQHAQIIAGILPKVQNVTASLFYLLQVL